MMRIAYISADRGVPVIGRTGSATHVREFVTALVNRGAEVTVLTACASDGGTEQTVPCRLVDLAGDPMLHDVRGRIAKELRAAGSDATPAAESYALLLNQALLEELTRRSGQFDLVYERQSLWSFAGLQFARRTGVPFFLEVNAPLLDQQAEYRQISMVPTARALEGMLLSGADRVIVTSPALLEYARSRGASRRSIRIIPCGVSQRMFPRPRPARKDSRQFVLGFVGSLKPWHGLDNLLDAFRELRRVSPLYRLVVVGDGPLRPHAQHFCRRHRLADAVTFVGSVDHERVPDYLSQIDVGLAPYPELPSFYFSPLKVWEYAAAGVPIVASASGDLPQVFPHRVAALLHPPGKISKIVKHVELLRKNPDLAARLARRARRIAKLHTWDRLAARFENIATRVLRARARG